MPSWLAIHITSAAKVRPVQLWCGFIKFWVILRNKHTHEQWKGLWENIWKTIPYRRVLKSSAQLTFSVHTRMYVCMWIYSGMISKMSPFSNKAFVKTHSSVDKWKRRCFRSLVRFQITRIVPIQRNALFTLNSSLIRLVWFWNNTTLQHSGQECICVVYERWMWYDSCFLLS